MQIVERDYMKQPHPPICTCKECVNKRLAEKTNRIRQEISNDADRNYMRGRQPKEFILTKNGIIPTGEVTKQINKPAKVAAYFIIGVIVLIAILFLIFTVNSCGSDWQRLENFNGQFSIDYPAGWEYWSYENTAGFTYYGDGVNAEVVVWKDQVNYFVLRDSFLNDDEYGRLIEVEDAISTNNQIYSLFSGQNKEVKMIFLIIWINDDETMVITCKTNDMTGDTYGKLIEYSKHMLDSLKITDNGTSGEIRGRLAACGGYVSASLNFTEVSPDDNTVYTPRTKTG
jgi:hypothetical protein